MKAIKIPCDNNLELSMQVTQIMKGAMRWKIIKPSLHFIKAKVMRCRLLELLNQIIKQWCSNNRNQPSTHVPELLYIFAKLHQSTESCMPSNQRQKHKEGTCVNGVCFSCAWGKITLYITGYKGLQSIKAVNPTLLKIYTRKHK